VPNIPLYVVDELVKILTDECEHGLRLEDICSHRRKSFMHHLLKWFQCPKAHLLHIGIESFHPLGINYKREFCDSVSIVYYNFLDQVHDLLNDISSWGDKCNFKGTINMDDPFSNEPIRVDGFVDEIIGAEWYKKTNAQCKDLSPNEPYLILPVVGYIDITGTDVNQRNKLEPFSFTLGILNHSCHYQSKAWRVLGFTPDLEHKSSAAIT